MSAVMQRIEMATSTINLRELLSEIVTPDDDARYADIGHINITDITLDSRAVQQGGAFIALPGLRNHGIEFAMQAISNGARVILWEPDQRFQNLSNVIPQSTATLFVLAVPDLKSHLGTIADRFFAQPSAKLSVAGVTGTNGKTTSAFLIAAAMTALHRKASYSGTLGFGGIDALHESAHTTPDCISVHRQLASMSAEHRTHVGMEVSSHALDQGRIDGVRVHTALFTNLTRDHLDYHGTFEAYGAAKEKLFHRPELQHAVINVGDEFGRDAAKRLLVARNGSDFTVTLYAREQSALTSFGNQQARLFASHVERTSHGLVIDINGSYGRATLRSRLIGDFNVENLLGVLGVLVGWKIPLTQAVQALEQCVAPPGRMENVSISGQPTVVVDYAHTPDALEKALRTAREHCVGRLICVFGCGGERDVGKRPQMGTIASRLSDSIIVTDDNPRMEDAQKIIDDILPGVSTNAVVIRDRERAIAHAIALAQPTDCILIAGKGHETYQIVGRNTLHFSDVEVARRYLNAKQQERSS
jgi:UDP-N-acetylmuramoyl-L-alanyl-D-glutamate--2,6-diaminopimelate ligase